VTIDTNYAPQASRFVEPADYPQAQTPPQEVPASPALPSPVYLHPHYMYYVPPYYPYYYPYYVYPYSYGPLFSFFFGYARYCGYPGYWYPGYYGYRVTTVALPGPFPTVVA